MRIKSILEWVAGFLVAYLLSPMAPPARWLLVSLLWLPYSPDLRHFNLPVMITLGLMSLAVPLGLYIWLRRRVRLFGWGLLIAFLTINVPSYALAVLVPFVVNF
jgi:hypothetical protein